MEIEELELLWKDMSKEIEKQKSMSDALIKDMIERNYLRNLNRIRLPEFTGSVIGVIGILAIMLNFEKLDSWYMVTCGLVAVLILLALPILSIRAIGSFRSIPVSMINYKEALTAYAKSKLKFFAVQKISFYLGAILLLTFLPVMVTIIGGKDPFKSADMWFAYIVAYPFFYAYARWVFKKYSLVIGETEQLLNELAF